MLGCIVGSSVSVCVDVRLFDIWPTLDAFLKVTAVCKTFHIVRIMVMVPLPL
jgi:hypothetical protein